MFTHYMEIFEVVVPIVSIILYAIRLVLKELRAMRADVRLVHQKMEKFVSHEKCELHRKHFENKLELLRLERVKEKAH